MEQHSNVIIGIIQQAIAKINQGYANSGIRMKARLVGAYYLGDVSHYVDESESSTLLVRALGDATDTSNVLADHPHTCRYTLTPLLKNVDLR